MNLQINDPEIKALVYGTKATIKGGTVTFSFYNASKYQGSEQVSPVGTGIKRNVRHILNRAIAPYVNINFQEVTDSNYRFGKLRFMFSDGPSYAYAYMPGNSHLASDVHFNKSSLSDSYNSFAGAMGNHGC